MSVICRYSHIVGVTGATPLMCAGLCWGCWRWHDRRRSTQSPSNRNGPIETPAQLVQCRRLCACFSFAHRHADVLLRDCHVIEPERRPETFASKQRIPHDCSTTYVYVERLVPCSYMWTIYALVRLCCWHALYIMKGMTIAICTLAKCIRIELLSVWYYEEDWQNNYVAMLASDFSSAYSSCFFCRSDILHGIWTIFFWIFSSCLYLCRSACNGFNKSETKIINNKLNRVILICE